MNSIVSLLILMENCRLVDLKQCLLRAAWLSRPRLSAVCHFIASEAVYSVKWRAAVIAARHLFISHKRFAHKETHICLSLNEHRQIHSHTDVPQGYVGAVCVNRTIRSISSYCPGSVICLSGWWGARMTLRVLILISKLTIPSLQPPLSILLL